MNYNRLAALAIVWLSVAVTVAFADPLGNYKWGASAAAIISQTGAAPSSGGTGTLVKRETILGRQAWVTYQFDSIGLSAVGIQWDEKNFSSVKQALERDYGAARCTSGEKSCAWTSQRSLIRLVETPSLGVTLLVFSKRP